MNKQKFANKIASIQGQLEQLVQDQKSDDVNSQDVREIITDIVSEVFADADDDRENNNPPSLPGEPR